MCILLGCDYCEKIPGIGPHKAINLIRKHKTIEEILKNIDKKKHPGVMPPHPYIPFSLLLLHLRP